jgi:hypothetical protein
MSDQDPIEHAYGAPLTDAVDGATREARGPDVAQRGLKVAAALMLVGTGVQIAFAIAEALLGVTLNSTEAFQIIASVGIGAGLWLRGAPFRLPMLAYLGLDATLPIFKAWSALAFAAFPPIGVAATYKLLHAFLLVPLLIGKPSQERIRLTVWSFVVLISLRAAAGVWKTYLLAQYLGGQH